MARFHLLTTRFKDVFLEAAQWGRSDAERKLREQIDGGFYSDEAGDICECHALQAACRREQELREALEAFPEPPYPMQLSMDWTTSLVKYAEMCIDWYRTKAEALLQPAASKEAKP